MRVGTEPRKPNAGSQFLISPRHFIPEIDPALLACDWVAVNLLCDMHRCFGAVLALNVKG